MAASDRRAKSQRMVAEMQKRGIFHGKRTSSPRHYNYPNTTDVGSAAYRRMKAKKVS